MYPVPIDPTRRYTVDEYFALDELSESRLEYIDGRIRDMDGENDTHSCINVNVAGIIWTQLRDKPCQGRDCGLRIRFRSPTQYGYADALIVCGRPQFEPRGKGNTTLLNPRVLIEIMSESTAAYDLGRKFDRCREIASLEEYVLIAQDRPSIEVRRRDSSGRWLLHPNTGIDAVAQLQSVGINLPLAEVYERVEFPAEPAWTA